jgi:DNA-directed RNA polymerase specialized sigma24 family protein
VEGECEEPFSCLTPLERKLLILIYIDKKTHEEIANDMRYHFSSIKRKKNDILEKLQRRMEELEDSEIY